MVMKIQELKQKTDTDIGTDKFSHYIETYGNYLNHLSEEKLNILEVGIKDGQSLRLWSSFFKKANIFGIDIDPKCKNHESDRINVIIGDQNKKDTFSEISNIKFDIIIDDGSHVGEHIINTFQYTFKDMLADGGLYFIEDTSMLFHDEFLGHKQDLGKFESFLNTLRRSLDLDLFSWNQIQNRKKAENKLRLERYLNKMPQLPSHRATESHPIATKVKSLTGYPREKFNNDIEYIHYYTSLIVIKKKVIADQNFGKRSIEEGFNS